jgi:alkyl sulfatase BDS1-like metallo-beta-lactamase superfamily hydrolase
VESADATLTLSHPLFLQLLGGRLGITDIVGNDAVSVEGSSARLAAFFGSFERVENGAFPLTTP